MNDRSDITAIKPKTREEILLNAIANGGGSGGSSGSGCSCVEPVIVSLVTTDGTHGTWSGATWQELWDAYSNNVAGVAPPLGTEEKLVFWLSAVGVDAQSGKVYLMANFGEFGTLALYQNGEFVIYNIPDGSGDSGAFVVQIVFSEGSGGDFSGSHLNRTWQDISDAMDANIPCLITYSIEFEPAPGYTLKMVSQGKFGIAQSAGQYMVFTDIPTQGLSPQQFFIASSADDYPVWIDPNSGSEPDPNPGGVSVE